MLLSQAQLDTIFKSDDAELQQLAYLATTHPFYNFEPRTDDPANDDQQESFVARNYEFDPVAHKYVYADNITFKICLGGNGSGKTIAAAAKSAEHLLSIPPPRRACPFWIIGEYMDQICNVGWVEKLSTFIPRSEILATVWHNSKRGWPRSVILRHPDDHTEPGWVIEFKSYEMGLGSMKSESIGGYWCNEEVPFEIVDEIQWRCRDYNSPGWADFTPIENKSPEWEEFHEDPKTCPRTWKFYHLNTELNTAIPREYTEQMLARTPEDMRDTRRIGTFSHRVGQVFKEFKLALHVVDPTDPEVRDRLNLRARPPHIPHDWRRLRGLDFGFNNPTACVWIAKDHDNRYYVFDEYYETQAKLEEVADAIIHRHWDYTDPYFGTTWCDHNEPRTTAWLNERGLGASPARKNPALAILQLRSLMMPSQGDGRPQFYVFSHCENTIRELRTMRYPPGTDTRNPQELPMPKNDHCPDAIMYAIYSDYKANNETGITTGYKRNDARRHGVNYEVPGRNGHRTPIRVRR